MSEREPDLIPWRVGIGYDVHRLVENRKLILGGVEIPFEKGLLGHSDADVLTHAIIDAILGAMSQGTIGTHFPDNDPQYKNINSLDLLERVRIIMEEEGFLLGNVDSTVICDRPKLAPFINEMRMNLSEALRVHIERISVKATTTEGLSFTGTGDGIAAEAVCILVKDDYFVDKDEKKKKELIKKEKVPASKPKLPEIETGSIEKMQIYTDGASDGNPGPSGIGIVFYDAGGMEIGRYCEAIGEGTNNRAEYIGMTRGVEIAKGWGVKKIEIFSDSQLVVNQVNGSFRLKSEGLQPLYTNLMRLLYEFESWTVSYVRREKNREADKLSKLALQSW